MSEAIFRIGDDSRLNEVFAFLGARGVFREQATIWRDSYGFVHAIVPAAAPSEWDSFVRGLAEFGVVEDSFQVWDYVGAAGGTSVGAVTLTDCRDQQWYLQELGVQTNEPPDRRGPDVNLCLVDRDFLPHWDVPDVQGAQAGLDRSSHALKVVGVLSAMRGNGGIDGLCDQASFRLSPYVPPNPSQGEVLVKNITIAIEHADGAEIIAIPLEAIREYPLPRLEGLPLIAFQPAAEATKRLIRSGGTVIMAAGNGGHDLDGLGIVDDLGAILVGAKGRDARPLVTSNHGSVVSVVSWGEQIFTCADYSTGHYLYRAPPVQGKERSYMMSFGNTSAATALAAGMACRILGQNGVFSRSALVTAVS